MRCALSWDEEKPLLEQSVSAWGEMQSLKENPGYKEADIADPEDREFFRGAKYCADKVCIILEDWESDDLISRDTIEEMRDMLASEICLLLFSILDHQE